MKISYLALFASLLIALATWNKSVGLTEWSQLIEMKHALSLAGALGPVILAWYSKSPIKPK